MCKEAYDNGEESRKVIMGAIIEYIKNHQYPPTVRELCEITGIKSTSTINHHITKLLESGQLESDCTNGSARALRVPGYAFVKADFIESLSEGWNDKIADWVGKNEKALKFAISTKSISIIEELAEELREKLIGVN